MKSIVFANLALGVLARTDGNSTKHGAAADVLRQQMIEEINSRPNLSWKAGMNERFRGKTDEDVQRLCGVQEGSQEHLRKHAAVETWDGSALPSDFDSKTNWPECAKVIGDIRDQSDCGCCWAFGAAEAASDRLCIASQAKYAVPLSAQETCFCAESDGCSGGMLYTPWEYLLSTGLSVGGQYQGTGPFGNGTCTPYTLPHCHHHGPRGNDPYPSEGTAGCPPQHSKQCPTECASGSVAPYSDFSKDRFSFQGQVTTYDSAQAIQQAIMNDGPVETAFTVYADFPNYVSGVYKHTSGRVLGGHAVRIVGWGVDAGVDYWTVANSWNPYWGESGYFRIVRGADECGIESQVTANNHGATWGPFSV
jgi:cathepsin B